MINDRFWVFFIDPDKPIFQRSTPSIRSQRVTILSFQVNLKSNTVSCN
ncbi:hypothetical protein OK016_20810 [Vibrio chagasii]|nr:hypothetical protein [Vibrio chagasii]